MVGPEPRALVAGKGCEGSKHFVEAFCVGPVQGAFMGKGSTEDHGPVDIFRGGNPLLETEDRLVRRPREAPGKGEGGRRDPSYEFVELVVNFSRVVAGKDPDPALKQDDVVIVKETFF